MRDGPVLEERWLPKSIPSLRGYTAQKFLRDLVAGITVGLVALPLAMAFSIAFGALTAGGNLLRGGDGVSDLAAGGSRTQIGGPTGAFVVVVENLHQLPPVVVLRLRNMTAIDVTGLFALEELAKQLHATKRTLILCGAREQPRQLIHQAEFEELIGKENFCDNVQEALQRAEEVFESLPPAAKAAPVEVS